MGFDSAATRPIIQGMRQIRTLFLTALALGSVQLGSVALGSLAVASPAVSRPLEPLIQPAAGPAPGARKPDAAPPPRAATLDDLYARLSKSTDESEAKGIVASIQRRWMRSGSDTADLLFVRAMEAAGQDQPLAIELLDRAIALQPDWAEAWNKRATIFFMMGDVTRSMADLREVLAREPRHFGALSGLGIILQQNGDRKAAYAVFQKALAINPFLADVKKAVQSLAAEVGGSDL
ncbi:tetratricopeptide repeat protein [Alsobacter sp. SYSU BS001988]